MKIALYRGKGIVSKLILWQTRSNFSHAALVLPDNSVIESREWIGVQRRPHYYPINGETCTLFNIHTTSEEDKAIIAFAEAQLGKPYDYMGILRFITREPVEIHYEWKWFCSAFVFACFEHINKPLLARIYSRAVNPGELSLSTLMKQIN